MAANKKLKLGFIKSIDIASKTVVAHVSTYEWDRMNERFAKGAWDLQNYLLNPVVLWSHDPSQPPIGKALRLSEDDFGLVAEAQFDDANPFAMQIFGLFQRGFLNAFSVGFIPKKWAFEGIEGTQDRGLVYQEAELLEFSAVSIPANPGAVVSREVGELVIKTLGDKLLTPVKAEGRSELAGFLVNADTFEESAGPEEPAAPTEIEAAAGIATAADASSLETSLKHLLDIAKMAKGSKLDKTRVEMLGQAVTLFQEIISENSDSVSREDFDSLKSAVGSLSEVVKNLYPDATETVRKIMFQVEKSLRARAA